MIASKISIGYFLLRITIRRVDIWIIYTAMILTVLTGVAFFFVTLFQCSPVSFFWRKNQDGTCVNMEVIIALTYLYSACSVVCDFTFAILPLILIWKLKMERRSKIALIPIMIMACVSVNTLHYLCLMTDRNSASTAVVVRFAFVEDFDNPDFLCMAPSKDSSLIKDSISNIKDTPDATVDIAIWSTTEQGLAITAGSLATLRPLFRIIGQSLRLSSRRPSTMQDSDQQFGEGVSHNSPNTPGSGRGQGEPVALATVRKQSIKQGHEAECASCQQTSPKALKKSFTSSNSLWRLQEQAKYESEEELTKES